MLGIGSLSARNAKTNELKKVSEFFISLGGGGILGRNQRLTELGSSWGYIFFSLVGHFH